MKHLENWFLEVDPTDKHDPGNYFSDKQGYSSEIYAQVDGNYAQIAYIPLVLTDADHTKIHELEEGLRKARDEYFKEQDQPKTHWWQKAVAPVVDEAKWRAIHKQYDDTELVYKPRHSKELHDAHLHLVLSAPYMYALLAKYRDTGQIDHIEVTNTLKIAEGEDTPYIERIPKWKQRNPLMEV